MFGPIPLPTGGGIFAARGFKVISKMPTLFSSGAAILAFDFHNAALQCVKRITKSQPKRVRGLARMAKRRTLSCFASLLVVFMMSATISCANEFDIPEYDRPDYVKALEAVFGAPSHNGFGSTVLYSTAADRAALDRLALAAYRYFTGELWEERGVSTWMGPWRLVHERTETRDILAELRNISDPEAIASAGMIVDGLDDPQSARAAIVKAFDDNSVQDLLIYNLGDGGAMSGLLIAARRINNEASFLVFLMD